MTLTNSMMAPPQMMKDGTFSTFQNNLHNFANVYAESMANKNSGLFENPYPSTPII